MKYSFEKKTNIDKYLLKIEPKYYPIIAFILSAISYYVALSLLGLLDNGLYIISDSDLHHQMIPFIEYFCKVIKGEHSFWYSWSLWMGSGTIGTFSYYTLSPFNIIYLIVGENRTETASGIIIILKIAFSAATYQVFISKLIKNKYFEMVLFSVMYSLCGFSVCYYFNIIYFDALYTLPLIMYSIICLIREKRRVPLILSYAFLIGVNFYMGYIVGISTFIIFIFCIIYKYTELSRREIKRIVVGYFVSVAVALAITAVIWLPTVYQFIELSASEYLAFENAKFNLIMLLNNLFVGQMQSCNGVVPYIYSGILSIIALPSFVLNRRIKIRKRICYICCLLVFILLMLIEPLNIIMHGFDSPNSVGYRYAFVISFILITILSIQFMYMCRRKNNDVHIRIILCVLFSCIYWFCNFQFSNIEIIKTDFEIILIYFVNIFLILLFFVVIDIYSGRKFDLLTIRTVFVATVILELSVNAGLCVNQAREVKIMDFQAEYMEGAQKHTAEIIKNEKGDKFYRTVYLNRYTYNVAIQNDIPSITCFNSLLNKNTIKAMQALGYGYTPNFIYGNGWTPLMNSILGVEYVIDGAKITTDDPNIPIMVWPNEHYYQYYVRNEKILPLAYTVNNSIFDYTFSDSVFTNQINLINAMTGSTSEYYEEAAMNIDADPGVIGYEDNKYILNNINYSSGETSVLFTNENDDGRPMYANFYNTREIIHRKTPAVYIYTPNDDNLRSTYNAVMYPNQIVTLGHDSEGRSVCKVVIPEYEASIYYNNHEFVYYNEDEFEKAYRKLKQGAMNVECFEDGYVKGSVNCDEDCVLFTSIPYEKSWHAYVNGSEVDICGLVENAFVGLRLNEGRNDIVLEYVPRGMKAGVIISIIGCIIVGLLCYIDKIKLQVS